MEVEFARIALGKGVRVKLSERARGMFRNPDRVGTIASRCGSLKSGRGETVPARWDGRPSVDYLHVGHLEVTDAPAPVAQEGGPA